MPMECFFNPSSLLLISDDEEFNKNFEKTASGKIVNEASIKGKKVDLLVVKVKRDVDKVLKKYHKMARCILVLNKLNEKNRKKLVKYAKMWKIKILNGLVYSPYSINTGFKHEVKKGNIFVLLDSAQLSNVILDYMILEDLGVSKVFVSESDVCLDSLIRYVEKDEETKLVLTNIESVSEKIKKKRVFLISESIVETEKLIPQIKLASLLPESKNKNALIITNGIKLPVETVKIEKKLAAKIKKYAKKATNPLDVGKNATVETFKKVIESAKKEVGLFVLAIDVYNENVSMDFIYGIAVLRNQGLPIVVYMPGGKTAKTYSEKLQQFSIPSYTSFEALKKVLKAEGYTI